MDCLGASPFHKQGIAKRQVLKTCLYTNTPNRLQWISKAKRSSMTIDGKLITVAPLTSACLLNCLQVSLHVQSQCYSVMAPNYASLQQRNLQLLDCELTATWPSARCCDACSLSLARPEKQMLRSELLPRIRFKKKTPTMTRVMPGPKEEKNTWKTWTLHKQWPRSAPSLRPVACDCHSKCIQNDRMWYFCGVSYGIITFYMQSDLLLVDVANCF